MSEPEREEHEFALLLDAHSDGSLTEAERLRLEELASAEPERPAAVEDSEALRAAFDAERSLRHAVMTAPLDADEAGDPAFRQLENSAAAASRQLGAQLRAVPSGSTNVAPTAPAESAASGRRFGWGAAVAAAVLLVGLGFALRQADGALPALNGERPQDQRLGGAALATILVDATLREELPELRWEVLPMARSYAASIARADAGDEAEPLLRRDAKLGAATTWRVSSEEFHALASHSVPLTLRVVAHDADGTAIGASGACALTLTAR